MTGLSLNSAPIAACAAEHFSQTSPQDQSFGNLFKIAHLPGDVWRSFGAHDVKWDLMSRVGNLAALQSQPVGHPGRCFNFRANSRVSGENGTSASSTQVA
jgi:hypothetical protein